MNRYSHEEVKIAMCDLRAGKIAIDQEITDWTKIYHTRVGRFVKSYSRVEAEMLMYSHGQRWAYPYWEKVLDEWLNQDRRDYLERHPHVEHFYDEDGELQFTHDDDYVHFKLSQPGGRK